MIESISRFWTDYIGGFFGACIIILLISLFIAIIIDMRKKK